MLPQIKKVKLPVLTLPTAWQTVIFRNYGYVPTERIAKVLDCDEETVRTEAARLGVADHGYHRDFAHGGHITIIRNNWYLLPYEQIMTLLGIDEQSLDFMLDREDFLGEKLGAHKPECEAVKYSPITEEQAKACERSRELAEKYAAPASSAPFSFFDGAYKKENTIEADGARILHGYLSPCYDVFATDNADTLPDELLDMYQKTGVTGVWLHGVLSELSPYPFDPARSVGYEARRANMKSLIERCKKYGIGLYLYLNEPRALPVGADPKFEHLIGDPEKRTLCMEKPEVRAYLYSAVRDLCSEVQDLGGIFTITMSENPTHCNYRKVTACPVCKNVPPERTASDVNNIILRGMRDAGCQGELIANLWCWSPLMGWSDEQIFGGIARLSPEISVMCVSEFDLPIEKGGFKSTCNEYSISNPGPSALTAKILGKASELGHKTYAKIQASNSWECSAVPYVPVFDLVYEHVKNLHEIGVKNYFLTWTLGGYPSPSLDVASSYREGVSLDAWYADTFGEQAEAVHSAVLTLCDAFREFPLSIPTLYLSPKNLSPTNPWDIETQEKKSSMIGFSFDDYETWTRPYPIDVYLSQYKKLIDKWKLGFDALTALPKTAAIEEITRYAEVAYLHYRSELAQTEFAIAKRSGDRTAMRECALTEREIAERLLALMREDAKIGFETSNHYFYTERNCLEKMLRMEKFAEILS